MPTIAGGCLCGAIRYQSEASPAMVAVCHCTACQKSSGSAFGLFVGMPKASVALVGDGLATYEDRANASGRLAFRTFCTRCGSPLSAGGEAFPDLVFLKGGSLDDPSWLKPNVHIWCDEKQPWVAIEAGVAQIPRNPA
jgi:hypothetical protein